MYRWWTLGGGHDNYGGYGEGWWLKLGPVTFVLLLRPACFEIHFLNKALLIVGDY